ncbi:hypothetical protein [Proteiniborus sp. MB09-C3]|uniref:hypothetical protein n=1 Tax=Proteiniborus sp. MB09-C3 TaxID=3050072 RepID=UPI0025551B9C|nr:hypothetical protein [Proteiniborus sp. MB09-C3]WIV11548.1 hypothetical protein QO263_15815 [Proteiniborus sp. MB09-C3]
MIINSEIFDFYLENGNIDKYKENWLFKYLEGLSGDMNIFKEPSYSQKDIQTMIRIATEIRKHIDNFEPNNVEIWNLLFPNWGEIISDVVVYFIVGLPQGFDALALQDESENTIAVYDIGNWLAYQNIVVSDVINNLLTHELCHVCINAAFPDLKNTYISGTYVEGLDAIAFNEGFAHLLAFENKNISSVDWKSEKFRKIYTDTVETMKNALLEEDTSKQKQYIQASTMGSYYERFGAMVGMLYLANEWLKNGNLGLKKIFDEGYRKFASKAIKND